jgi:16S rRNA (guanine966-N2)-methyltransferase
MRVISGSCRGRKLVKINGDTIRPTSDRVKEAIFNILGPCVRNATVLDLFAGTGALGIEALSRGASEATFVDVDCGTVKENLTLCRLEKEARVIPHDMVKNALPTALKWGKI